MKNCFESTAARRTSEQIKHVQTGDEYPATRPTAAQLAILQVLWARGPSTVHEVREVLNKEETGYTKVKEAGYTTVLKLMQIMLDKGLKDLRHALPGCKIYRY